jgi:putative toxin-antitoxin system antitoxin component (TIGR02293 family)
LTNTTKCIIFTTNDVVLKKKSAKYSIKEGDRPLSLVMEKEMPFDHETNFSAIIKDDAHLLINKSRTGMAMYQIENLMKRYDLTLKEMAAVLNISERTLQRYEDKDVLSKDASERALHLQRLYERGADVFGTLDNFCGWMKSPVLIFSNEKPISFLDTIFGFELLEQELGRIEHGIFA